MRVIAGTKKRTPLITMNGIETRPTTDRIKETLFNMIADKILSSRFLDLYAGSGQIGIEALSRGAMFASFVESNRNADEVIRQNLKKTMLTDSSELITKSVLSALNFFNPDSYDIIFMDPPYQLHEEEAVLEKISQLHILKDNGLILIEADISHEFNNLDTYGLCIQNEKKYKTNKHVFITYK